MQVREIMNRNVVTVGPQITLHDAAKKMVDNNTKFLIVTGKERLVGIVTEWDFVKKIASGTKSILDTKLESIITKKVIVISPTTEVSEAAEIMAANNIKRLPIVENNVLIGVVTAMEIMAAEPKLIEQISELFLASKKEQKSSVAG
jgi:CBS domain-containing protein